MKAAVTSTQCASPQYIASGNAERTIIIYYQWGPAHILSIHCPYCRRKIDIKLSASKVWYVAPDTWLAS